MKRTLFLIYIFALLAATATAQIPKLSRDYALLLTPRIDSLSGNYSLTLTWEQDSNAHSITVYLKEKWAENFGEPLKILSRFDTSFVLRDIEPGKWYEIAVERDMWDYLTYGYMNVGIRVPAIENRGKVLLLIDETLFIALRNDLERLTDDLIREGWQVYSAVAPRAETFDSTKVMQTKAIINEYYDKHSINAAVLIGRIAVPYSGSFAIDGHSPDHDGAWATDIFYAVPHGKWTDTLQNLRSNDERTRNRPGDGKFDQTYIPADAEIAIGRIDMYNLPAFPQTELQLLRRYFEKNHNFRSGKKLLPTQYLISDAFGPTFKEGFSASAWMSFATMLDWRQIRTELFRDVVSDEDFLWAYGCGPGSFVRAETVAYSDEFAVKPMRAVFTQLFGSYFGDWDTENNLMRAAIATEPGGLICVWSGRPHWFFHHTAFGETIAYSTLISQNSLPNQYPSISPFARRMNHIALIGDPTLKTTFVKPPDKLISTTEADGIALRWNKSSEPTIAGYYLYASPERNGKYERIHSGIISDTFFVDDSPKYFTNYYMVRTVKLTHMHSGSFYDLSPGILSAEILRPDLARNPNLNVFAYPNPASDFVNLFVTANCRGIADIELRDINGKLINNYNVEINSLANEFHLKLCDAEGSSLPQGVYYLNFEIQGNKERIKLLIAK